MDDIKTRIKELGEIPTLPAFFHKIMSAVESDTAGAKDLAEIIRNDPSLTSKILKLANSAYYGRFKAVATVDQAVMTIGFNEIKTICLSMGVFGSFDNIVDPANLQKFWVHALTTAVAIQEIGDRKQECSPEKIYYGGLMHDIGKLVLLLFFTEQYLELINSNEPGSPSLKEEKALFGASHAQAGKWLCEHWNFPNELSELIVNHHAPERGHLLRPKAVQTVYLGDKIAHHGTSTLELNDKTTLHCIRHLQVTAAEVEAISAKVESQQARIEETFSLIG